MLSSHQQIKVLQSLDVEAVERELARLWTKTTQSAFAEQEMAVMRARVANLIICLPDVAKLDDINTTLAELGPAHPCRALVVAAERVGIEHDIEMFISSICQEGLKGETTSLSCEEVTLIAAGKFIQELPSATLPLLIPDLPVFLWWRDSFNLSDSLFSGLSRAADRLIVDSVDFPPVELASAARISTRSEFKRLGISDINWARLTSWRSLLANFYDVSQYRPALESLSAVNIDYVSPQNDTKGIAPQALLIAGWLASRLEWQPVMESQKLTYGNLEIDLKRKGGKIRLILQRVERSDMRPGRLARVSLNSEKESAVFEVRRNDSGLHLETRTHIDGQVQPGQLVAVRNRSIAQLLGREMEILCNDDVYAEAIGVGLRILG